MVKLMKLCELMGSLQAVADQLHQHNVCYGEQAVADPIQRRVDGAPLQPNRGQHRDTARGVNVGHEPHPPHPEQVRLTIAIRSPYNRHTIAIQSPYKRLTIALQSPYNRLTIALQSPYNRLTIALQSPYNRAVSGFQKGASANRDFEMCFASQHASRALGAKHVPHPE